MIIRVEHGGCPSSMKKIVRMLQMAVSEVAVCGGDQALV